jgi:hypothetical protein
MATCGQELVVEKRDDHGQPAIISVCATSPPSSVKIADDKKLSKKRRRERQALKSKDQNRLNMLYSLPKELEAARKSRQENETTLKAGIKRLRKEVEKEAENNKKVSSTSAQNTTSNIPGQLQSLTEEDERRLKETFLLPRALENLRKARINLDDKNFNAELFAELDKLWKELMKIEEEAEKEEKRNKASQVENQVSRVSSQPGCIISPPSNSSAFVYVLLSTSVTFFLMALFPAFRSIIIKDLVCNFFIGAVAPPLLRRAFIIGEEFTNQWPLASFLIVSLYNIFGFWVLAAAVIWALYNLWVVANVVKVSARAFAMAAASLLGNRPGKFAKNKSKK